MSGQSGGYRLRLSTLNDQLTCKLCGGYFIDATTIIECLHSFCRSCIIKYLENNKYCPICEVQVHKSKPLLNVRTDHTLQDIVYKLVPGCYQNEMRRRREFYNKHPEARAQTNSPESRGEPIESHVYSQEESLSLSLEYYVPKSEEMNDRGNEAEALPKRYLRCPAAVTIFHLQKLIRAKYGLSDAHRVDILYKEEPLCGNYTLMDVLYVYHWRRKAPLHLSYRIFESSPKRLKLSENNRVYEQILSNSGVDLEEKKEESETKEWKEVQLKISETGVMSVTDISTFDKKEVINGDENVVTQEEMAVDKGMTKIDKTIKSERVADSVNKNQGVKKFGDENVKSAITVSDSEKNLKLVPRVRDARKIAEKPENASATTTNIKPREELQTKTSSECKEVESENSVTAAKQQPETSNVRSNESITRSASQKIQERPTSRQVPKTSSEYNETKLDTGIPVKTDSPLVTYTKVENAKAGRRPSTSSDVTVSFQPKLGQVNNTYSKKIMKEKKVATIPKKFDTKSNVERLKIEMKTSTSLTDTKPPAATMTRLPSTTIVSSPRDIHVPRSTTTSTQTVNNFVTVPQSSCLFVSTSRTATSTVSASTTVTSSSTLQPCLPSTKSDSSPTLKNPNSDKISTTTPEQLADSKSVTPIVESNVSVPKPEPIVKNTNNNESNSVEKLLPTKSEVTLVSATPSECNATLTKLPNSATESIQKMSKTFACATTIAVTTSDSITTTSNGQNTAITSTCSVSSSEPTRSTTPQTSSAALKRTNSKCGREPSTVSYTVPPCPDAIPISLMKPTVRKHEIIAKGTNLNEICAKIGESSKEKIKAATRSKAEIPNLLKITKKNANEPTKFAPNLPAHSSPNSCSGVVLDAKNTVVREGCHKDMSKTTSTASSSILQRLTIASALKKYSQSIGYKTLRDPPKSWNPTLSKNNYVAAKNQAKEMQTQSGTSSGDGGCAKSIPMKPAKIFKNRNVPRYLGNPASGVKPMYGASNEGLKDKEPPSQQNNRKNTSSLTMMTIDPKTLSPIVTGTNSPVSSPPPPYSPNARTYQNAPFPREVGRAAGSPISPRNSPVNMLSTNPFIPSPTLNTNPRFIYTPYPPPFPDTSRFPNPLIRSPIGIPSPSAFHSSLPPSIKKPYQRSSYLSPTSTYSATTSSYSITTQQPPTVQKIQPSIMHVSPKSPKSPIDAGLSFGLGKNETATPKRVDKIARHLAKTAEQQDMSVFDLLRTGNHLQIMSSFPKLSTTTTCSSTTIHASTQRDPATSTIQTTRSNHPPVEIKIPDVDTIKRRSSESVENHRDETNKTAEPASASETDKNLSETKNASEPKVASKTDEEVTRNDNPVVETNGKTTTKTSTRSESVNDESKSTQTSSNSSRKDSRCNGPENVEAGKISSTTDQEQAVNESKAEEAVRKSSDQGKKCEIQRNKSES